MITHGYEATYVCFHDFGGEKFFQNKEVPQISEENKVLKVQNPSLNTLIKRKIFSLNVPDRIWATGKTSIHQVVNELQVFAHFIAIMICC